MMTFISVACYYFLIIESKLRSIVVSTIFLLSVWDNILDLILILLEYEAVHMKLRSDELSLDS